MHTVVIVGESPLGPLSLLKQHKWTLGRVVLLGLDDPSKEYSPQRAWPDSYSNIILVISENLFIFSGFSAEFLVSLLFICVYIVVL